MSNKFDKIATKILEDVKKYDENLWEEFNLENFNSFYIVDSMSKIYRHLHDAKNPDIDFKMLIRIEDHNIIQYEVHENYLSENQYRNSQKLINNLIINYGFENIDFSKFDLNEIHGNLINAESKFNLDNLKKINLFFQDFYKNFEKYLTSNKSSIFSNNALNEDLFSFNVINFYLFATINFLLQKDTKVAIIATSTLFSDLKKSFSNNEIKFNYQIFQHVKKANFLFLENLNPLYMSDWFIIDILFPLLDYRFNNDLLTIITINSQFSEFQKNIRANKKNSINVYEELLKKLKKFKIITQ